MSFIRPSRTLTQSVNGRKMPSVEDIIVMSPTPDLHIELGFHAGSYSILLVDSWYFV